MINDIIDSSNILLGSLTDLGFKENTINCYRDSFRKIIKYCSQKGIIKFDEEEAKIFSNFQKNRFESGEISHAYSLTLKRAAFMLVDRIVGHEFVWKPSKRSEQALSPYFEEILENYNVSIIDNYLPGTIRYLISFTIKFLQFLELRGKYDFKDLLHDDVIDFFIETSSRHHSKDTNIIFSLKKFFTYLNDTNLSSIRPSSFLNNPIRPAKKVLPCLSLEEINSLLSAIDTTTKIGKRDYAIIHLAIGTGLRGVDIRNMKLNDIDWRKKEISIIQHKTGNRINLPLSTEIGNAVADYILNSRPKTSFKNIFLSIKSPIRPITCGISSSLVKKYLTKSGLTKDSLDGKSFHALRRTVGTRLVEAKVPLPEVAQILGHKKIDSTKRYIDLNIDMLRECCLDISIYNTKKVW
jgi:site-specific recombinase XerD